ncbi:MAG: ribose-5-phosphate isomerase, partial [Candidatus Phytoplasma sp.]|nr:ribose-5-phosphate isomerase [Phytoplasma sp.]
TPQDKAFKIIDAFLDAKFEDRHQRRIDKITEGENE